MLFFFDKSSQTIIYTAIEINPWTDPNPGIQLNDKTTNKNGDIRLDMVILVNNNDFDNDDNPYGTFRLHMYSNM